MNPYDFVPIDFTTSPKRRPPLLHDKFQELSGRIDCQLTAETSIFIPETESPEPKQFITRNDIPIIPGSSLKGMLRNLVETIGSGCFVLFDEMYERRRVDYGKYLPKSFRKCDSLEKLCIACRMFGMLERGEVFLGNVSVSDATTEPGRYTQSPPIYTKALMEPKPRHQAFYLRKVQKPGSTEARTYLAGRKFYFHSPRVLTDTSKTKYNQHICPLAKGSVFTFTVDFTNLSNDELPVLLYALALEPTMRHKIGLAKPLGLGSVKIEIKQIILIDYKQRYTTQAAPQELTGTACDDYIKEKIAQFTNNKQSETLNALRRIWKWDPQDRTIYAYPDQGWFRKHSQVSVGKTL
jgi:CRISPR/Cas system CSM-associated protein Csm3 (group 7 of RAMP superfamily)